MADVSKVELVLDARAQLGEGAIWNDGLQRLHWIDIEGQRVFTCDPLTGENRAYDVGQKVGTVVPRTGGGVMLALQEGFASLELATGRFWAGTMALRKGPKPLGRLYRLDADGSTHVILHDVGTSNGIAWSLDRRTLYYIDTPLLRVDAFDYDDATGNIANRRTIITVPPGIGRPDGSTIDAAGMLWVAMWEGGRVTRWNPHTGELLQTIRLPVSRVTSCAFGGPDFETLYLTSARNGLSDEQLARQPLAGGLFRVKPGVCGMRAPAYQG
jgi:sugar lactone lactonase YvrE